VLPAFPGQTTVAIKGVMELVIDEAGRVESVKMRESLHPRYDRLAVDAARHWKYAPATVDGVPVKFRKLVQVSLKR
jgi:TonB family protein